MIQIRVLATSCLFLMLTACGPDRRQHPASTVAVDTMAQPAHTAPEKLPRQRNRITDSMLAQITRYYEAKYGNDSVRMSISRSDTVVELIFADTSTNPDAYHGTLLLAQISLVTDVNPVLSGDLNGDDLEDLLVSVHTEGGGGGGNVWWNDHFVFLADADGRYSLANTDSGSGLADGNGYFFPRSIEGGSIIGVSNEYAEDDGHCCPSLFYRRVVRMKDGELVSISKVAIPRPEGF